MPKKRPPPVLIDEDLARAFDTVLSFPEGHAVMEFIYALSGYSDVIMRFDQNTSELNIQASLYNLAMRDMWRQIRLHVAPKDLARIENPEGDKSWTTTSATSEQSTETQILLEQSPEA